MTGLLIGGLLLGAFLSGQSPPLQAPLAQTGCPHPGEPIRVESAQAIDVALVVLARCTSADLEAGRWRAAEQRLDVAARAGGAVPPTRRAEWQALVARLHAVRRVDGGQWASLVRDVVPFEDALPWVGPLVRGVAAARASWAGQDTSLQALARAELARLVVLARAAGPLSEEERARLVVQAAMAGAQYEREEMQLLLEAAHQLEERLLGGDLLRNPVVLARELEADLLRLTDRYAAASERYRALLEDLPRRVQARIGLADAYRRLGYLREADETLAQARALWAAADPEAVALLR